MLRHESRQLGMVLAGGEGKRLMPLTADRAKPAVPFGGTYRLIDFALSNLVNAGVHRIAVLTQYKSHSLDRHISLTWSLSRMLGNYVTTVPAQMRVGPRWFLGSADAVFQNLNLIRDDRPDHIFLFGADHIYRMDPRQMLEFHKERGAGLTLAGIRVPIAEAPAFGIIDTERDGHVKSFLEKPQQPPSLPDDPSVAYASMGIYIFTTEALVDAVTEDASNDSSKHDIGGSIVPLLVERGEAFCYDFMENRVPGVSGKEIGYWRDVGDLDAFYEASMDLVAPDPAFNLYNQEWPMLTFAPQRPPAKFVFDEEGRRGTATDSLVSAGAIVSGSHVSHSVLSPDVFVHSYATVEGAVLMDGVDVGRHAVVRNAIVDKNVRIEPGAHVGVDPERDRARFHISQRGIVAIPKGMAVRADGD
ncbi:MAG: glucose-1-phosphate adenylyltransferase [Candidatus Dormibacteraeota bacterium]|nr:glucose-1-phosphate adenylyltransferase [Candidatus Dormibacteraeota bacterium]MBO0743758.1 glucose-1-phosphate adenylyltransferase [Candidatus Dormibacteraeota bacterium]